MNSILIGKIVNVHGIKGEVKVYPYTDDLENLTTLKAIFFDQALKEKYKVKLCRIQKNMLLMKLEGINTVEQANQLRDANIYIPKEKIEEEDTYYIEDLIGLAVYDQEQKYLGKITYVFATGANDVYEMEKEDKQKIYLPAIKDVIKKVDIPNGKIYVEMMEGLI